MYSENQEKNYICHVCQKHFKHLHHLKSHLNRKNPCVFSEKAIDNDYINCDYCNKKFTKKGNLLIHLKKQRCTKIPIGYFNDVEFNSSDITYDLTERLIILENQLAEKDERIAEKDERIAHLTENSFPTSYVLEKLEKFEQKFAEITENPRIIQNNLQIVCVGQNDNYLDMLTQQWGNFNKALEYIRSCALSSLVGDCKLLEKIYITDQPNSIQYINKGKTKIQYFDENNNKIVDNKIGFGKKIANNLQNSYLKGINHLINDNLDNNRCPNKFLDNYDLQTWNQHIYELSNVNYHKKIVDNLNIESLF